MFACLKKRETTKQPCGWSILETRVCEIHLDFVAWCCRGQLGFGTELRHEVTCLYPTYVIGPGASVRLLGKLYGFCSVMFPPIRFLKDILICAIYSNVDFVKTRRPTYRNDYKLPRFGHENADRWACGCSLEHSRRCCSSGGGRSSSRSPTCMSLARRSCCGRTFNRFIRIGLGWKSTAHWSKSPFTPCRVLL